MKLVQKGHRQSHRGVIGVESAIVMIAFVIVAAALAFVVLNMGFSTTQKAKTTIVSSLGEASSALEVSGKVTGSGNVTNAIVEVIGIPIKLASGGDSVNLAPGTAAVKYLSNSVSYDNIYAGTLTETGDGDDQNGFGEWRSLELATDDAADASLYINSDPYDASAPTVTRAFIYWTQNINNNDILDQGEHAVLAIAYNPADRPTALDKLRAEVLVPTGSALTIERQVPSVTTTTVDLG